MTSDQLLNTLTLQLTMPQYTDIKLNFLLYLHFFFNLEHAFALGGVSWNPRRAVSDPRMFDTPDLGCFQACKSCPRVERVTDVETMF